ncbi:30S ribosomal protein S8 [Patescibacteria group bacterium]|nr:30S ribosomal protein S8 [Patescibacteria group bacterium]MBU4023111.1 30S ribosomal protein S8 [Patescibacteria group bacterium]MBU4078445.1 30S ribosomal protein S8 [Patescibacteria group bacterium]
MTDPIADMIIRIKNAQAVNKASVDVPYSNLKHRIAEVLANGGYILKTEKRYSKTRKILRIELKYDKSKSFIREFRRISKPGKRIYISAKEIKLSAKGGGMIIISTSKGIMPAREARRQKQGGELIAEVW